MEEKITPEEKRRILSMAIATYGADMQIIVAIEEMSELIKAITKYIRADIASDDISEIVADAREEMADVRIMLDQLVIIFGDTTEEENPRCPCCGEECETLYRVLSGAVVGCEKCVDALDVWEYRHLAD